MMFFFPSHLLVTLFFSTLFWVPHPGRFHWPDLLSKRVCFLLTGRWQNADVSIVGAPRPGRGSRRSRVWLLVASLGVFFSVFCTLCRCQTLAG